MSDRTSCPCDCHRGGLHTPCNIPGGCWEYHQPITTPCNICQQPLAEGETNCCEWCISRTRNALTTIRDTDLQPAIEATAYNGGDLPGGVALILAADGNDQALRPYKPQTSATITPVEHPPIPGRQEQLTYWQRDEHGQLQQHVMIADYSHPAYLDTRPPADGREHFADHWPTDPVIPAATVESIAREWRNALGEPLSDALRDTAGWCDWMLVRLRRAAQLDTFPDDADTLRQLASTIANVAGLVNHPEIAPAACFDCGGQLVSRYREPLTPIIGEQTRRGTSGEGREMADTDDGTPMPIWQCANRDCARSYQPAEYWLAVHATLLKEAEKAG